jgi:hypothetical protein
MLSVSSYENKEPIKKVSLVNGKMGAPATHGK